MENVITMDALHVLFLGVMLVYCKHLIWKLLLCNHWGRGVEAGRQIFEWRRLRQWYKRRHSRFPDEKLTRASNMTQKMLGEPTDQKLKARGAEVWGILLCLVEELEFCRGCVGALH